MFLSSTISVCSWLRVTDHIGTYHFHTRHHHHHRHPSNQNPSRSLSQPCYPDHEKSAQASYWLVGWLVIA